VAVPVDDTDLDLKIPSLILEGSRPNFFDRRQIIFLMFVLGQVSILQVLKILLPQKI